MVRYFVKKFVRQVNPTTSIAVIEIMKKKGGQTIFSIAYSCLTITLDVKTFSLCSRCDKRKEDCPLNNLPLSLSLDDPSDFATTPWINKVVRRVGGIVGRSSFSDKKWEHVLVPRRTLSKRNKSISSQLEDRGAIHRKNKEDCYAISGEILEIEQNEQLDGVVVASMSRELTKVEAKTNGFLKGMRFVKKRRRGLPLPEDDDC